MNITNSYFWIEEVIEVLNKKSGVFGLSGGVSSDFRDLHIASDEGNKKTKLAVSVFKPNLSPTPTSKYQFPL